MANISVQLHDGLHTFRIDEYARTPDGEYWAGRGINTPSTFEFVAIGNVLSGNFWFHDRYIRLAPPAKHGDYVLEEVREIRSCSTLSARTRTRLLQTHGAAADPTPDEIDVLVLYTSRVREARGGADAVYRFIRDCQSNTNEAYTRSGVKVKLRLAAPPAEVAYEESGSLEADLQRLELKDDRVLDEVHALRDTTFADVVVLLVADDNEGGMANEPTEKTWGPTFEDQAFAVVDHESALSNAMFAHEVSHIFGCGHDRENTLQPGPGLREFSAGYHIFEDHDRLGRLDYRTIMAYRIGGDRMELLTNHFSNPVVIHRASQQPTGSSLSNNARTLNEAHRIIAGFRTRP